MAIFRQWQDNGQDRSAEDRRRNKQLLEDSIKKNIGNIIAEESIIGQSKDKKIKIPIKSIKEYQFVYGKNSPGVGSGDGSEKRGDKIGQDKNGKNGHGDGKAGNNEGEDIYETEITIEELVNYLFDDLNLPDIDKRKIADLKSLSLGKKCGYQKKGIPPRLAKRRSVVEKIKRMQGAVRAAMEKDEEDKQVTCDEAGIYKYGENETEATAQTESESKLELVEAESTEDYSYRQDGSSSNSKSRIFSKEALVAASIDGLESKESKNSVDGLDNKDSKDSGTAATSSAAEPSKTTSAAAKRNTQEKPRFPFIEDDLRYHRIKEEFKKDFNAVVICIMDVSGSMDQTKKYMARSFYFMLYQFLRLKYENVEVVFVAHTTVAKEVNEAEFFHKGESGGTYISSGYEKALEIIEQRYNPSNWNIYSFHCSDGDNWTEDNKRAVEYAQKLCNSSNLFGYGEIVPGYYTSNSTIKTEFLKNIVDKNFVVVTMTKKDDILPALKKLLEKEGE